MTITTSPRTIDVTLGRSLFRPKNGALKLRLIQEVIGLDSDAANSEGSGERSPSADFRQM
jgi:hypothetical protein